MTTKFRTTIVVDVPLDQFVLALMKSHTAVGRLVAARREDPTLKLHSFGDNTLNTVTEYRIPLSTMPAWMSSRFKSGGPVNERTEEWVLGSSSPVGTVVIKSKDSGSHIEAEYELTSREHETIWTVDGWAKHPAPIIGARVETFLVDSLTMGYQLEGDYLGVQGYHVHRS